MSCYSIKSSEVCFFTLNRFLHISEFSILISPSKDSLQFLSFRGPPNCYLTSLTYLIMFFRLSTFWGHSQVYPIAQYVSSLFLTGGWWDAIQRQKQFYWEADFATMNQRRRISMCFRQYSTTIMKTIDISKNLKRQIVNR